MAGLPILLGDSLCKRLYNRNSNLFSDLSGRFCVSGQRASELLSLIVDSRQHLKGKKVFVLIGTNDLYGKVRTPVSVIKSAVKSIVALLRNLKCSISLCEVPPIPKLGKDTSAAPDILEVNSYIRTFEPSGVKVVHSHDIFCEGSSIRTYLFCKTLKGSGRVDLVHPNAGGLDCLLLTLEV